MKDKSGIHKRTPENNEVKKIAVVLSGCGFLDGAEITESVATLIALSQNGADYEIFAPDKTFRATNYLHPHQDGGTRNILEEAARIARGKIRSLSELKAENFDGIVLPGGYGAATHLCTWGSEGARCSVDPHIEHLLKDFYTQSKPICAICIAPVLVARVLGDKGISLTIGHDAETAAEIAKTGAQHVTCAVDDYVTDREHKIISTPAYMYPALPHQVFAGISAAIREFVEMA